MASGGSGMNKKQAQIIIDIAEKIKDVPECAPHNPVSIPSDFPVCFFANGYRFGVITRKQAEKYQYSDKLSEKFNVSRNSADNFIYGNVRQSRLTGKEYAKRAYKFLDENGWTWEYK
jgi:hypothetical protein